MPENKKYIVSFVDILGFSDSIRNYDSGKNPEILDHIKQAINSAGNFLNKQYIKPGKGYLNWKEICKIQFFSDCLCAAVPMEFNTYNLIDNFIFLSIYLSTYQNILMEKGFFTRGGISIGSYFSDEYIIFSGALLDSVEIEKTIAKFPRIVLSEKLVDQLKSSVSDIQNALNLLLVVDSEKNVFINNFGIHKVTNYIFEHSLKKINKENKEFVEKITKMRVEADDFEIKENIEFLNNTKKIIRKNLIEFQYDWYGIFQKYLWIKKLYDWNRYKTRYFQKFASH